ncbi:unnamed protein product [Periconia digitata]|uniref:Uncharacterized protein n=1 Tax=Periconia digitata TaxID=1303443 RepID=A0A9W4UA45_9PLEO|nr:unnamed protein product [Periconia digitata]
MESLELLVHTSAPSTKQDDDIYRALAEDYIQFAPTHVHRKETTQRAAEQTQTPDHASSKHAATPTRLNKSISVSFISTTSSKDLYGSFPSQLYSEERVKTSVHRDSQLFVPDDQVPSSRLGQLERMQTKWQEEQRMKQSFGSSRLWSTDIKSSANWEEAMIDDTQLAFQVMQSQVLDDLSTTSEGTQDEDLLSETQYEFLELPAGSLQVESPGGDGVVSETQYDTLGLSFVASTPEDMQDDDPVSETHLSPGGKAAVSIATRPQLNLATVSTTACARTDLSPILPEHEFHVSASATNSIVNKDTPLASSFHDLPLEILPPPPKVTVATPRTLPSQVTHILATLKDQNPEKFMSLRTSRKLAHDERGHWMIDCTNWPLENQAQFWFSFGGYVRSGRLGWGVGLYRDDTNFHGLGVVRVYCWGEVVEHIWLLLWLCSKGRISNSGTQWLDAGEEVVVA